MFLRITILSFFLIAALPSMSFAQDADVSEKLKRCSVLKKDIRRLVCYDEIVTDLGAIEAREAQEAAERLEKMGFWEIVQKQNSVGEDVIYLKNDSLKPIVLFTGSKYHPTLTIKCRYGETDVYIDWKRAITTMGDTEQLLTYKMGAGERKNERWEMSDDKYAIFSKDPITFVRELREHDTIIFEISPTNESTHTVVHDLTGIRAALKKLVKECYQ